VLASKEEIYGELDIQDPGNGTITRIPRIDPHIAQRTLGVLLAPDGNNKQQLQLLLQKTKAWANSVNASSLHANEKWIAYNSILKPGLLYPLPTHQCSVKDLATIQTIVDQEILHSQHLSTSFPCVVLRGPIDFGGLGIPSLHSETLATKIIYFIHHMRRNDVTGHKLRCSLGHLQLEIGIGDNVLQTNYSDLGFLATTLFITDLWTECSKVGITLHGTKSAIWVPSTQHKHDYFIMDLAAMSFTKKQLIHINICRLFTKTLTISDFTTYDGKSIHPHYLTGHGNSG